MKIGWILFFLWIQKKLSSLRQLLIPLMIVDYASAQGITETKLLFSRPFLKHTVPSTNA